MKVRELIEVLRTENQDAEVHLAYNYGDHSRTTVAPTVDRVEAMAVAYSNYFRMPTVIDEDDDTTDGKLVVVLFNT